MISPSPSSAITSRSDISEMMVAFDLEANLNNMIALRVLPQYDVRTQFGPFRKVTVESLLRVVDTARASGGAYNSTDFQFTEDSFSTKENGLELPLDDRNQAIYGDSDFGSLLDNAILLRNTVMTNLERRVSAAVFNTGTFTPTPVTNEWDDAANATPMTDVEAAVQRLYDKGFLANALICNWKVFRNLRNCDQIIERINSQGAGQASKPEDITTEMLARVFDLKQVIVGGSQYNAANEGQTADIDPNWSGEYAMVTRVAMGKADRLVNPSIGRTFHWDADGSQIGGAYETYYDPKRRSEIFRLRMETQEKVLYSTCGELLSNITA